MIEFSIVDWAAWAPGLSERSQWLGWADAPYLPHGGDTPALRSEEHTSELQSQSNLVCRLLLEKKKTAHLTRSNYLTPERQLQKKHACALVPLKTKVTPSARTGLQDTAQTPTSHAHAVVCEVTP